MSRVRCRRELLAALTGAALLVGSMLPTSANLSGAIFTTDGTATAVNQNLYADKGDVYLNGGPQNTTSNGLPPGTYYFQVTTPSGVLLSTDDVSVRTVTVSVVNGKGVVYGPGPGGTHAPGQPNSTTGAIPVQLQPFDDSPNGEYKAWLSPDPTFPNNNSKTDNFRITGGGTTVTQTELSGLKYRDTDLDGVLGPNDTPIPGWTIQLRKLNTNTNTYDLVDTTTTDADGSYQFLVVNDGASYQICEVQQPGWTQTGPIPGAVPIVGGVNQSYASADATRCWLLQTANGVNATYAGLDFGNIPAVTIGGVKYNDANMNGQQDPGEGTISNPTFTIQVVAILPDATHSQVTDTYPTTNGVWTSKPYPSGTTFVATEINVPANWLNTGGAAGYKGTVGDTATTGLDFGNIQLASIGGAKYNDANMNGQLDPNETLIPSGVATFTFHVDATLPNGTVVGKDYTNDATGHWQSDPFPFGTTFAVSEVNVPANWLNTGGSGGYQGMVDGTNTALDFGNVPLAPIGGVKYNDANMNGKQDAGENPIPSGTATFTFHVVATLPNGTVVTKDYTNDATGHWQSDPFPVNTSFVVTETSLPPDWQNTGPAGGYQGVVDGTNTALDFGNIQLGQISGVKYDDVNTNGSRDPNEALIPNSTATFTFHVVATLPNGTMVTKDYTNDFAGHWVSDPFPVGTSFTVTEINVPANWLNTGGAAGYPGTVSPGLVTGLDFGNVQAARIGGVKYYDANGNGQQDPGEPLIPNSAATFTFHVVATLPNGTVVTRNYTNDATGHWQSDLFPVNTSFVVTEINVPANWMNTGGTAGYRGAVDGTNTALNFGNLKLGAGGGLTLGFWSNNNGAWSLNNQGGGAALNLGFLTGLNLRSANGSNFDPTTVSAYQSWLLSATATNMAYMLSAQLSAMELNVRLNAVKNRAGSVVGGVNGGAVIYAPGTNSANALGFATVGAVMTEANTLLGTNSIILSGDPLRARAEALKIALDKANNNLNFVQPFP